MSIGARRERAQLDPVTLPRTSAAGESLGQVVLDPEVFSVPVNVPLLHQVVTAQLAARRSGTQSTRTRAEVRGGASKPYRQKGTGNARQGSIRAPHYSGGGVALGPKPRDYAQRTPRKMVQAALRCALSDRARSGGLRLVDRWAFEAPKTKDALASLTSLECEGTVLLVLSRSDETAAKSFANLPHVVSVPGDQLTAYDVLSADVVIFTDETLPGTATASDQPPPVANVAAKKAPARKSAASKAAASKAAAPTSPTGSAGASEAESGAEEALSATEQADGAGETAPASEPSVEAAAATEEATERAAASPGAPDEPGEDA